MPASHLLGNLERSQGPQLTTYRVQKSLSLLRAQIQLVLHRTIIHKLVHRLTLLRKVSLIPNHLPIPPCCQKDQALHKILVAIENWHVEVAGIFQAMVWNWHVCLNEVAGIFQAWMLMPCLYHNKKVSRNRRGASRVPFETRWAQTGERLQQNVEGNAHHHCS